jgi:hypothetical protein
VEQYNTVLSHSFFKPSSPSISRDFCIELLHATTELVHDLRMFLGMVVFLAKVLAEIEQ